VKLTGWKEPDLLRIVERELDDPADLLVVDPVHDRHDRNDFDARLVQVVDRLQLHIKQVAHLAVRVGRVADPVKLQVRIPHTGFRRLLRELQALCKLDAVGRSLHAVVPNLACVPHRIQEVGRQRRLAARELYRHLPARLDRDRVVQHRLDVVPGQLMHEPDLVRVHEARIAHHVAAVGQIDGQHRSAPVLHRRRPVVM
jgi:hypothetical protein